MDNAIYRNARSAKMRALTGPLTTEETNKANVFWVKRVQTRAPLAKYYQEDQLQLNLQPNSEGVLECRGRIQGHYPRFQEQAFSFPPQGNLPKDRTEGKIPFQVVGVDYAGPLKYRKGAKTEGKAYVLLYACSLTRALFLDFLPSLETTEFLASLKRFIARRGRPQKMYSDNGKTFVVAAKWIK